MSTVEKEQKGLTRRDFVKGAAAGGVAGLVVGGGGAALLMPAKEAKPWLPAKWDYEADVVVCGYGAAGMPAAIDAHDAGADVLILEKLDWLGGSCRRCGGGIAGAGTIVQAALGIVDSPAEYYQYLVACGQGWTNTELNRVLADNSGKNVNWLIQDLGGKMPFTRCPDFQTAISGLNIDSGDKAYYQKFGLPAIPRIHWVTPAGEPWKDGMAGGTGLFKAFDDAIKARKIRTMTETGLIELVATSDREVLGVKALSRGNTLYIKAKKAVVLATGGWAYNAKLVRNYLPSEIGKTYITHPDQAHGDGIIAGEAIGADLANMGIRGTAGTFLAGGLRINIKAQVIDVFDNPIPRLYAGGVTTGGHMYLYPNSGTSIANAVCFGRIAGKNAAIEKPWG